MPAPATRVALLLACLLPLQARAADDILLADFEGPDYGAWKVEGDAFGTAPAHGTLPNQHPVAGFLGKGLVNSYLKGDRTTGSLTSPPFTVGRKYLNFLIGGGADPEQTCAVLLIDGQPVRSTSGNDDEHLTWATWDLADLAGKRAQFRILDTATGGWGHVNVDHVVLSDTPKADPAGLLPPANQPLYDETYRPQFHFTAKQGWLNDPNGLVYANNAYHLFFQHNPKGNQWGNMTWGHATSPDLLRWKQLDHALYPDATGTMFSGSAVVDHDNTAGFGKDALILIYTAAGGTSPESKGKPFTQCLAYSTDGGQTFTKYDANPVLPNVHGDNRDPKVFWHPPTKRWIMTLYVKTPLAPAKDAKPKPVDAIQFFASPDLKKWEHLDSDIPGFFECPDFFPLAVDGNPASQKWVLFGADGDYTLGDFDGRRFTPDGGVANPRKFKGDHGNNFYAAQTYADIPAPDGRRILIGWMRGGRYPRMPFNQQMSVPVELSLRQTPDGPRLRKWPVREIATLYADSAAPKSAPASPTAPPHAGAGASGDGPDPARTSGDATQDGHTPAQSARELAPNLNALPALTGDCLDLEAVLEPKSSITFDLRGAVIRWDAGKLTVMGKTVDCPLDPDGRLRLRILLDRASVETFVAGGLMTFSNCFTPKPDNHTLSLTAQGQGGRLISLKAHTLKSAWR